MRKMRFKNLRKRKQKEILENEIIILYALILNLIAPIILNVLNEFMIDFNEMIKTLIEITKKEVKKNGN